MRPRNTLIMLAAFLALCIGVVAFILNSTAEYPDIAEPVSYPVNQLDGFELSTENPSYSPFKGYTLRYKISSTSDDTYYLAEDDGTPFEYLEMLSDGQWYRLACTHELVNPINFGLDKNTTGFQGSVVQKHSGYGTRLNPGTYRLTMELTDQQGSLHYLAAEFDVK